MNLLREKGPALCYHHLDEFGLLTDLLLCLTSAELFFLSNYVEQAFLCLKTHSDCFQDDERFPFFYSKYCIYSGRVQAGFKCLAQITRQSSYYNSSQVLTIIALILLGNFEISIPSESQITERTQKFLEMLSQPGTYKVGGLGACTLISAQALRRGVSFRELYNLGLTGEDRHFCIRAVALGLELYADTHYPPFHIYRESELVKLQEYKKNLACAKRQALAVETHLTNPSQVHTGKSITSGKITLAMLVRNESDRHLERVLKQAAEYIDQAVIIDDASTDNTVELCQIALAEIPLTLHSNKEPQFHNEIVLRRQLWEMALSTNSEWIIILDADELFEEDGPTQLCQLLNHSSDVDCICFRLFDLWTEDHYREDPLWQAHKWFRPFIVRNIPGFRAEWQETPQHCGRFPENITDLRVGTSPLRIKHLGGQTPRPLGQVLPL